MNAYRTLMPWPLGAAPAWFGLVGMFPFPHLDWVYWSPSIDILLLTTYLFTIPGALSLSMTLPAYLMWLKKFRMDLMVTLVTIPVISAVLFFGFPMPGLSIVMAQPLIPILIGAAVNSMRRKMTALLFLMMVMENIFFIWFHVYLLTLFLTRVETASDMTFVAAAMIWALAVARLTYDVFRSRNPIWSLV